MSMIGHNLGPDIAEAMAQQMQEEHADQIKLFESTLAREQELPPEINDETVGKFSDFIKKVKTAKGTLESIRKAEKAVWSERANAVHNFFKKKIDVADQVVERVNEKLAPYLKAKEDEERRAREEKERIKREEAERKLKEAQEKEAEARRKREEAEAESRRIEAENERKRKEAEAEAERIRLAAEESARKIREEAEAKAKAQREAAEKAKREAEAADAERKKKILDEEKAAQEDLDRKKKEAADAEARAKEADRQRRDAEKQAKEIIKSANREAKDTIREARAEIAENAGELVELNKEVREAERDKNRALDVAVRADREHARAEKQTLAGSAQLSRTRGDGSVASISEHWTGEVTNREELDLEALRDFIPFEALNQAVRAWVRANEGNRNLKGAHIYQETRTAVR